MVSTSSSLIVMGLLAMENHGWIMGNKIAQLLGEASYSIYLTHLFTLGIFLIAWVRLLMLTGGITAATAYFVVALTLSALLGVIVDRTVEMPLLQAFKRRRGPRPRQFKPTPLTAARHSSNAGS